MNRGVATTGQIGFHGVFTTQANGVKQTSSDGNADVGYYIAQLGFSSAVADYVTYDAPNDMEVLTPAIANALHLNVNFVDLSAPASAPIKPVVAPAPIASQPALPAAQPTAPENTPYVTGRADRQNWETWFNAQSGSYRSGAEYWAGARNTPGSLACEKVGSDTQYIAGCQEARRRLAAVDRQRRTSADYKAGWNSV